MKGYFKLNLQDVRKKLCKRCQEAAMRMDKEVTKFLKSLLKLYNKYAFAADDTKTLNVILAERKEMVAKNEEVGWRILFNKRVVFISFSPSVSRPLIILMIHYKYLGVQHNSQDYEARFPEII